MAPVSSTHTDLVSVYSRIASALIASNAALLRWADEQGIALDCWETSDGTAWRARAEHYLTNPAEEPDPATWQTDVAFLTAT